MGWEKKRKKKRSTHSSLTVRSATVSTTSSGYLVRLTDNIKPQVLNIFIIRSNNVSCEIECYYASIKSLLAFSTHSSLTVRRSIKVSTTSSALSKLSTQSFAANSQQRLVNLKPSIIRESLLVSFNFATSYQVYIVHNAAASTAYS